jgi:hypothetical protein
MRLRFGRRSDQLPVRSGQAEAMSARKQKLWGSCEGLQYIDALNFQLQKPKESRGKTIESGPGLE